jgi:hypothetical protein
MQLHACTDWDRTGTHWPKKGRGLYFAAMIAGGACKAAPAAKAVSHLRRSGFFLQRFPGLWASADLCHASRSALPQARSQGKTTPVCCFAKRRAVHKFNFNCQGWRSEDRRYNVKTKFNNGCNCSTKEKPRADRTGYGAFCSLRLRTADCRSSAPCTLRPSNQPSRGYQRSPSSSGTPGRTGVCSFCTA